MVFPKVGQEQEENEAVGEGGKEREDGDGAASRGQQYPLELLLREGKSKRTILLSSEDTFQQMIPPPSTSDGMCTSWTKKSKNTTTLEEIATSQEIGAICQVEVYFIFIQK